MHDVLALMIAGEPVYAKIYEYIATSMQLTTRDEILSAMVVYGFLSGEQSQVFIPNKELMEHFERIPLKQPSLGYVHRLSKEFNRTLKTSLNSNTNTMLEILTYAHNTEIPLLNDNHEMD